MLFIKFMLLLLQKLSVYISIVLANQFECSLPSQKRKEIFKQRNSQRYTSNCTFEICTYMIRPTRTIIEKLKLVFFLNENLAGFLETLFNLQHCILIINSLEIKIFIRIKNLNFTESYYWECILIQKHLNKLLITI